MPSVTNTEKLLPAATDGSN